MSLRQGQERLNTTQQQQQHPSNHHGRPMSNASLIQQGISQTGSYGHNQDYSEYNYSGKDRYRTGSRNQNEVEDAEEDGENYAHRGRDTRVSSADARAGSGLGSLNRNISSRTGTEHDVRVGTRSVYNRLYHADQDDESLHRTANHSSKRFHSRRDSEVAYNDEEDEDAEDEEYSDESEDLRTGKSKRRGDDSSHSYETTRKVMESHRSSPQTSHKHVVTVSYTHTPSPTKRSRGRVDSRVASGMCRRNDSSRDAEYDEDEDEDEVYEDDHRGYKANRKKGRDREVTSRYEGPPVSVHFTPTRSVRRKVTFDRDREDSGEETYSKYDSDQDNNIYSSDVDEAQDDYERDEWNTSHSSRRNKPSSAKGQTNVKIGRPKQDFKTFEHSQSSKSKGLDEDNLQTDLYKDVSRGISTPSTSNVGSVVHALQDGIVDRAVLVDDLLDRVSTLDAARADAQKHAGDLRRALVKAQEQARNASKHVETSDIAFATLKGGAVQLQEDRLRERREFELAITRLREEAHNTRKELTKTRSDLHACQESRGEYKARLQQHIDEVASQKERAQLAERRVQQLEESITSLLQQANSSQQAKQHLEAEMEALKQAHAKTSEEKERLLNETHGSLRTVSTAQVEAENRAYRAVSALDEAKITIEQLRKEKESLMAQEFVLQQEKESLRNQVGLLGNSLARVEGQVTELNDALRMEREQKDNLDMTCSLLRRDAAAQDKNAAERQEFFKLEQQRFTQEKEQLLEQTIVAERTMAEKTATILQLQKELESERQAQVKLLQEKEAREREAVQREREISQQRTSEAQVEAARREAFLQDRLESAIRVERQTLNDERAALQSAREAAASHIRAEESRIRDSALRDMREELAREQRLHAEEMERLMRSHSDFVKGEENRTREAISKALGECVSEYETLMEKLKTSHTSELAREKVLFGDRVEELVRRHEAEMVQARSAQGAAEAQCQARLAQAKAAAEEKGAHDLEKALAEAAELHRLRLEDQRGSFREQLIRVNTELEDASRSVQASLADRDSILKQYEEVRNRMKELQRYADECGDQVRSMEIEDKHALTQMQNQYEIELSELKKRLVDTTDNCHKLEMECRRLHDLMKSMGQDFNTHWTDAEKQIIELARELENKIAEVEMLRAAKTDDERSFNEFFESRESMFQQELNSAKDRIIELESKLRDYELDIQVNAFASSRTNTNIANMRRSIPSAEHNQKSPNLSNSQDDSTPNFSFRLPSAGNSVNKPFKFSTASLVGLASVAQRADSGRSFTFDRPPLANINSNTANISLPSSRMNKHQLPPPPVPARESPRSAQFAKSLPSSSIIQLGEFVDLRNMRGVGKPNDSIVIEDSEKFLQEDNEHVFNVIGKDEDEVEEMERVNQLKVIELALANDDANMLLEKEQLERRYKSVQSSIAVLESILAHKENIANTLYDSSPDIATSSSASANKVNIDEGKISENRQRVYTPPATMTELDSVMSPIPKLVPTANLHGRHDD